MSGRQKSVFYLALLLITVIPLFSFGLSNHGLWTADEPRVAEIGREMALSGNWAVPTLNQEPFLEEPPLYYASLAAAFRAFGPSDVVARIPSAVFSFVGIIALYFLGSLLLGPRTGFIASVVMATCGEYFRVAHWVIVDSALTCFVILALVFFIMAYLSNGRPKRSILYGLCYVSCTLAFYVKGFIGVVIPGLAVLTFLAFDRNLREVLRMHLWLGVLIFLAMTLPWFLSLWHQGGNEYLKVFFVHNHLERFAGGSTGHSQPVYYYLVQFPTAFLPWGILTVPVFFRSLCRQNDTQGRAGKGTLLMLCWFAAGFIFLSVASTKRALYLMPLFAPASLLTAAYIDATMTGLAVKTWEKTFIHIFGLFPLLAGIAAVPALAVVSRKLGFDLPAKELVLTIFFSAAAVIFSAVALWKPGKEMPRFWMFSSASVLSLLFLGLTAAIPVLDHFKSFVPFCEEVQAAVPSSAPLYAWQPDETLKGAVPFYTGRFLKDLDSVSQLENGLHTEKNLFIIIRDKKGVTEQKLLSTGKVHVLFKQSMDTDRSLAILKATNVDPAGE